MILNYETIKAQYEQNMQDNLRGFAGGEGFLQDWICDEDAKRSVESLFSLADKARVNVVHLEVPERVKVGGPLKENVFESAVDDKIWLSYKSPHALQIETGMVQACVNLGIYPAFKIIDINDEIVTLRLTQEKFEYFLIKIERQLKENYNLDVNLQCETLEDRNKRG